MSEHSVAYVAQREVPRVPAPRKETGFFGTLRKNLFATSLDSAITIALAIFVIWGVWRLVHWGIMTAVFTGDNREACLPTEAQPVVGACWAFVNAKFGQIIYGLYPIDQRWRIDIVYALLAVLTVPMLIPSVPWKRLNAILLFVVFPFVALVLLTGGNFAVSGAWVGFLLAIAALASVLVAASSVMPSERLLRVARWLAVVSIVVVFLNNIIPSGSFRLLGLSFTTLALIATLLALGAVAACVAAADTQARKLYVLIPPAAVVALVVLLAANFGLTEVPTHLWGGLLLTLVVALVGIVASLPLGILLALGRRSHLPAVRLLSIIFIEFWRGVPLITVLFMSTFMIPLLLPEGVTFNNLLRALIGVALFTAAYLAEVVRGGLQAIPKGQFEGAQALGLSYWQMMRLVIMPQALKLVIPGIVNSFISMFKDTSLVYIIGLADLLGTVRRGFADPNWITPTTAATGLVFAGFLYWVFCFGMSRYSQFLERRFDTGYRR
jgi:amine acid ABC transporter, permease protein, 3-TM region, His/Glu/Gln/Arg/opine family